jgi:hypothetical protein
MIKKSMNIMIALFFAFLLKGITYAVGNFNFTASPLFSFHFFCDLVITLIYYLLFIFIINKIGNKKGVTYRGKVIKDMQKNGLRIYLDGEDEEITIKSDDELFVLSGFINDSDGMRGLSIKRI